MADASPRVRVWKASFVMFGTIVGAGIFGLPYVVARAGYASGLFWMTVLAGAVTLTHVLYGEVVSATAGEHRLVGYVRTYLGRTAAGIETVASTLGVYGASLAYLILGGLFVSQIVSPIAVLPAWAGSVLMFLLAAAAAWWGVHFLSRVDVWLTVCEMSAFVLLALIAFTAFRPGNLAGVVWSEAFLPYGVVLFAYGGLSAINEIRGIVGKDRPADLRRSIMRGTLMAAGLTAFFVTAVVGALGDATTPESIGGLISMFGGPLPIIGGLTGFLSILTTYLVFGANLKSQFQFDFGFKPILATLAAVSVPLLLYLLGVRSLGKILELVGAVLIGFEGIFVALMYLKVRGKPGVMLVPRPLVWLLIAVYGAGGVYELTHHLF